MRVRGNGFTLIELMVTIAVLAIIAMMAAPSLGAMINKQNLNKSSSELIATLSKARAKAALERREITVAIGSLAEDNDDLLNWAPSGKSNVKSGANIIFMPNGLVRSPTTNTVIASDTTFVICENGNNSTLSKTIVVSRMGSVQQPIAGDCT